MLYILIIQIIISNQHNSNNILHTTYSNHSLSTLGWYLMAIDEKFQEMRILKSTRLTPLWLYLIGHSVSTSGIFTIQYGTSYHRCMLSTVDIRGAFLNAEFTPNDTPICLEIYKDVVPYWTGQDPNALPNVSTHGELLLLLDRFLYGLKQSPLTFQLHLSRTLIDAGYKQSINDECLFHKRTKSGYGYISTNSDDLLQCVSCKFLRRSSRILW